AAGPIIAVLLTSLHVSFRQAETEARAQADRVTAAERAAAETARHLTELRESEDRFESAFTHAAIGMVLVSTESRIILVNAALARLLGRPEAEFAGMELEQMFHADDHEALRADIQAIIRGDETTFPAQLPSPHIPGTH